MFLVGNVEIKVNKDVDIVNGRVLLRNISSFLMEALNKDMFTFCPSLIRGNSLELICEVKTSEIDFTKLNEKIESLLKKEFNSSEFEILSTSAYELSYANAAKNVLSSWAHALGSELYGPEFEKSYKY